MSKKHKTVSQPKQLVVGLLAFYAVSLGANTKKAQTTPDEVSIREGHTTPLGPAGGPAKLRQTLLALSVYHPRLLQKARELSGKLAEAKSLQRRYPDPRVGLAWTNAPYRRDLAYDDQRTPMTGFEYRLMQAIPFPGRLSTAASLGDLDARIKRLELAADKNQLARELLLRLLRLREIRRMIELTQQYSGQIQVIAETARTRYAVGRSTLADVSRAELTYSRYLERLVELRGMQLEELRQLNYLLGPLESHVGPPPRTPDAVEPMLAGLSAYLSSLDAVRHRSPDELQAESVVVALRRVLVRRGQKAEALAAFDYLPDMELFAAYRVRANVPNDPVRGEDFVSFGITFRVPLWSALSTPPLRDARKAQTQAARAAQVDTSEMVRATFLGVRQRYETAYNRLTVYAERLIPQAERAKDSAREAYVTGKVDFEVLLVSWDALYMRSADVIRLESERDSQLVKMADIFNHILPEGTSKSPGAKQ